MSTVVGLIFLFLWRSVGLVALPMLWLHPRTRHHLRGLLAPEPGRTWLHGASAGENVAAQALAQAMMPRPWRTHLSMRTPIRGTAPAPLDLPFVFSRWLDRARPSRLVLIESELWPGWLSACRSRKIPVLVLGSRESRGTRRWKWIPGLWTWLTQDVVFFPQSEIGDLKTHAPLPPPAFALGRPTFIAASTRKGDEARLLDAWSQLETPPLLLLAPRRLERVPEIQDRLEDESLKSALRSENCDLATLDVLVLDSMGELAGLFPLARAAFIGGTFTEKIGGHSPAEAFRSGLPVVAGPHRAANPAAWTQGHTETVPVEDTGAGLARAIARAVEHGPTPPAPFGDLSDLISKFPTGRTPAPRPQRPGLWPLVPLWKVLSTRRTPDPVKVSVPVISVGGITAGGSGKTPAVAWLAEQLEGAWIVSRGYRRGSTGPEQRVGIPGTPPEHDLGDELEMMRRRGVPVVSSPDRVTGATLACERGARFILLDDSFQNRALHRDIDIVCVDRRWPQGRGPIPVGTARESWSSLSRADWIWLHHDAPLGFPLPPMPERPIIRSRIQPVGWRIQGEEAPLSAVEGPVDVVVGVARPEGFLCTLLDLGLELRSVRVMSDHAPLDTVPPGCVMTEKDAARLPVDAHVRALVTELQIEGSTPLLERIRSLVSA